MKILTHIDTFEEWKARVKLNDKILCHYCPHADQCMITELPGSGHCFAVLQHRNPLENI